MYWENSRVMAKKFLIAAGGTGGHIFPGLAVADLLKKSGHDILWVGTKSGLEVELVPKAGYLIKYINISGIRKSGLARFLCSPWKIFVAIIQALKIIYKFKPDTVLCMGGYISGPCGIAAWILRKKLVIHEQNALAGSTNKILERFSDVVLQGFPGALRKGITVGNPVNPPSLRPSSPAPLPYGERGVRILVLGGSRGALAINECIPEVLAKLKDNNIKVTHQTGKKHIDITKNLYKKLNIKDAEVVPFIDNMPEAYNQADLVIARAGALTIAELASFGLPSILIPYPFAVDNHQTYNARFLADCGAAIILPQSQLTVEKLANVIQELINDQDKLKSMGELAKQQAKLDATTRVVNALY